MDYLPNNLAITDDDKKLAKKIIDDDENMIIRYLRKDRTVHYAKVPVRNEDGALITGDDGKWETKNKLVICSGIPTGALVAIKHNDELRIGWSRRMDSKVLLETHNLHAMFEAVMKDLQKPAGDYDKSFRLFCNTLAKVMAAPAKDVEIMFSKKVGRETAVLRALTDDIIIHKNTMVSAYPYVIPNEVVRGLKWFIPQAEETFGMKARNVCPEAEFAAGKELTHSTGTAVTTV